MRMWVRVDAGSQFFLASCSAACATCEFPVVLECEGGPDYASYQWDLA